MNFEVPSLLLLTNGVDSREELIDFLKSECGSVVDVMTNAAEKRDQSNSSDQPYQVMLLDNLFLPSGAGDSIQSYLDFVHDLKVRCPRTEVLFLPGQTGGGPHSTLRVGLLRHSSETINPDDLTRAVRDAMEYQKLREAAQQKQLLERLIESSAALLSGRNRQEVLERILQIVRDNGFDRARLYLLSDDEQSLTGVAQSGMKTPGFVGVEWPVAKDYHFKQLLKDPQPRVFPREAGKPEHSEERLDKEDVEEWASVPLILRDKVIGHLSADNKYSRRKIQERELAPLALFAAQAAAAIEKADLIEKDKEKLKRLEMLSRATTEIISSLGKLSSHDLLTLITKHATEILASEVCTIMLVNDEGSLSLEASYGHREGGFSYGKQFIIRSGFSTGLTGHIAYKGELFNSHGEKLINHFAVRSSESVHTPSGKCYSLLALPLKKQKRGQEKLIGLLRADNKKGDDDLPHPTLAFTTEDEWILSIFAEAVTVCLESAHLVEQLREQQEVKNRLIKNSPLAVIASNPQGQITDFNEQAERILGYTADEAMDTPVRSLYYNKEESRRVRRLLDESRDGRLVHYPTTLRDRFGQSVPIHLTAVELKNGTGQRTSIVGYFEDMRLLKEYERRVELLLRASNIVAQAEDPTSGLQSLAEMIVTLLPDTFCRILLFDEGESYLTAEAAAYFSSYSNNGLKWAPDIGRQFAISYYKGLDQLLRRGKPETLRRSDQRARQNLEKFGAVLGLEQPIQSLLLVPLKLGDHLLGLLDLGEFCPEAQTQFTQENIELVASIAAQSSILIDRMLTLKFAERGREKLLSFYRVSNELSAQQDPEQLLHSIVEEALKAAEAIRVHLVLIDEQGRAQTPISIPPRGDSETMVVRSYGISMEVFRTGLAEIISDTGRSRERLNPTLLKMAGAAICLPMSLPHKRIGVMWIHYPRPRRFVESEIVALQLYVNQAAIAYENAQEMERLERLREAVDAFAHETETDKVLNQILLSAKKTLRADGVIFMFFDSERGAFIQDRSLAYGIPEEIWEKYRTSGPNKGGTAHRLMEGGWVFVPDVNDPQEMQKVGKITRNLLSDFGARGFSGGALRVGQEMLGVIYAVYHQPFSFSEKERQTTLAFGRYAALALKRARLIEQVKKTNEAAEAVAKITVLGDRRATLEAIVAEVKKAVDCDAVVLFEYDRSKHRLLPPTAIGVRDPEKMLNPGEEQDYPLIYQLLEEDKPRIVEQIADDPDFKDRRFARDEEIKSCIAVPLQATEQKVGVMFINYRRRRRFTTDEIQTVQLFADQAALAVRYAQFTEERAKKLKEQGALVALSAKLRRAESPQEMMDCAVSLAADALGVERCNFVMPDQNGDLILRAQVGWGEELIGKLKLEKGKGSQTGYTIMTKRPVVVTDYRAEREFEVPEIVLESGLESGMSVPMFRDGQVVGALLAHTERPRRFSDEDITLLSLIADQTAVAISAAERYEELKRKSAHLSAVHRASGAITASFGREQEVLDQIVRQAVEGVNSVNQSKAVIGTIQLYDEDHNELVFKSVYPAEAFPDLVERVGYRRSLDAAKSPEGKIGVTGRSVREKQSQLVEDVSLDPDYIIFNGSSKSELSVPMMYKGKVLGSINVECDKIGGFDKEDQTALEALAEIAVIAIQNARQYEELKETKVRVAANTTLAWLGMTNNHWRHIIAGEAAEIRNRATVIRELVKRGDLGERQVTEYLDRIEFLIKSILEKPITPPLSSEQGATVFNVNDLVIERLKQLRQNERYSAVSLETHTSPHPNLRVLASSEWLRRAIDILVDNAADAVRRLAPERRVIKVSTDLKDGQVEIVVADRGPGIPEHIRSQIFEKRIEQGEGLGMGLLIAQAIVETYGGRIHLGEINSDGAKMIIRLPHKS